MGRWISDASLFWVERKYSCVGGGGGVFFGFTGFKILGFIKLLCGNVGGKKKPCFIILLFLANKILQSITKN